MTPSGIESRARARFGEPNRRLSTRHELRFGRKGSVKVQLTGDKAGLWYDHESLQGGTLLVNGEASPLPARSDRPRFDHDTKSSSSLPRILNNLQPVHGTAAELYLLKRGITKWPAHSIRFCRSPFGLCGLAQSIDGAVRACQVIGLTDDGRKRPNPYDGVVKRTYTQHRDWHTIAAVRLPGRGEPILCEGIETGLSIWASVEPQRPVLVCLGLAGIGALRVAARRLTIARDGDLPSKKPVACPQCQCPADHAIHMAIESRERHCQAVRVAAPPPGLDFNDLLIRSGPTSVAKAIADAS